MASLPHHPTTLHGGCLCKAVRYTVNIPSIEDRAEISGLTTHRNNTQIEGPTRWPLISLDHCTSCRLATGGLLVAWLIMPSSWITFELENTTPHEASGEDAGSGARVIVAGADLARRLDELQASTKLTEYRSSEDVSRTFCGKCGTALTYAVHDSPDMMDVTVGSLDKELLESEGFGIDRQGWWVDGVEWIRDLSRKGDGGVGVFEGGSRSRRVFP